MLVNRATEYLDNGEIILHPKIKQNDEWIFEERRETHILKGKSYRPFVIIENGYFWKLNNGEKFITHQ